MTKIRLLKSDFELPSHLSVYFLDFGLTFREMVLSTSNRLYIASYVVSPAFPFMEDLRKLKEKTPSVDIRILVDATVSENLSVRDIPYADVKFFDKGTLHMKLVISDGLRCIIGSHNITYKASEENYEVGIYIEGKDCYYLERLFIHLWNTTD